VEAEGTVSKTDTGYCFSEIVIRPSLKIPNEEHRERAISLLHKAKALCLISRALARPQKFEARVEISESGTSNRAANCMTSNEQSLPARRSALKVERAWRD